MFYHYSQNNSGGVFATDEKKGIGTDVIIEADSYQEANDRAERIGLYFHGCSDGIDCDCCGDRWYEQYSERDADEVPSIYGTPVEEYTGGYYRTDSYVHYKDGTFKMITFKD